MTTVRLNFVPHAFLFPQVRQGEEIKCHIQTCLYASEDGNFVHSSLIGLEECEDLGHMYINNPNISSRVNQMEIHIHNAEDGTMAISPNNGAFLLNLTFPFVNFYALTLYQNGSQTHIAVFNVTIVNDETMRITRELDQALNLQKLFTNTPVKSQITQEKLASRLPSLYINVLQRSTKQSSHYLKGLFSYWLEQFAKVQNQEA
mmetsp:Transcript_965/g.974  ORF Transcript_965/g.974 Transcript_965/m.974 type:complete len:203 (+) Transcript_965:361-969(+)